MSPTLLETYRPGILEKPSEEQGTFLGLSWSLGLKPQASLPSPGCHWISILGYLSVTEAANHVSVIFICRCFILLLEGVESEPQPTSIPAPGGQQTTWPSEVPAVVAGFSPPRSHTCLPRVHSLPRVVSHVLTRGHPSDTVRDGRDQPRGSPPRCREKDKR